MKGFLKLPLILFHSEKEYDKLPINKKQKERRGRERAAINKGRIEMEEKNRKSKKKVIRATSVAIYILVTGSYLLGGWLLKGTDLEYRYWVDILARLFLWVVPVIGAGAGLLMLVIKAYKRKKKVWEVIAIVLFLAYLWIVLKLSFFYLLFSAFTVTYDEKMPDGNLIAAEPYGMDSTQHYAEPVGILFRRRIAFDENKLAESLSTVYGVDFKVSKNKERETVFISDAYPDIETKITEHGYTKHSYLQTDLRYLVTSKALQEREKYFENIGAELVDYVYGITKTNPEGHCTVKAILITEDNKEATAEAISTFIHATLGEDKRGDGESLWKNLDGSIFLQIRAKDGKSSSRNIPFSAEPDYSWIYGEDVTAEDILEILEKELQG